MLSSTTISTPIGELRLVASDSGLREITLPLPTRTTPSRATADPDHPVLHQAVSELREYFAGERQTFDVPLDMVGTSFQRTVWDALRAIPYGETQSYGGVAQQVGRPGGARAVGGANGRNPVPIVIPCHRVIGADGSMTGYGGPDEAGIAIKRWLLAHEGAGTA